MLVNKTVALNLLYLVKWSEQTWKTKESRLWSCHKKFLDVFLVYHPGLVVAKETCVHACRMMPHHNFCHCPKKQSTYLHWTHFNLSWTFTWSIRGLEKKRKNSLAAFEMMYLILYILCQFNSSNHFNTHHFNIYI